MDDNSIPSKPPGTQGESEEQGPVQYRPRDPLSLDAHSFFNENHEGFDYAIFNQDLTFSPSLPTIGNFCQPELSVYDLSPYPPLLDSQTQYYSPLSPAGKASSENPVLAADVVPDAAYQPPDTAPATQENTKTSSRREVWTPGRDRYLLESRHNGRPFSHIARDMSARYPEMGKISENRLVKRVQKLQGQDRNLGPVARSAKRALPKIIAAIQEEMKTFAYTDGSNMEQSMEDEVLTKIRRELPAFIQNTTTRYLKTKLSTSLERDADS